jgi:hypothetical protein
MNDQKNVMKTGLRKARQWYQGTPRRVVHEKKGADESLVGTRTEVVGDVHQGVPYTANKSSTSKPWSARCYVDCDGNLDREVCAKA